MMLWCTSRSIAAAVVMGSLKIFSHFENGRLLVRMMLPVVFYIESRRFLIRDSPRPATTYEQKTGGADGVKGA